MPAGAQGPAPRRLFAFAPLALAGLLLAAVYGPRLGAPLVWDDLSVIVNNADLGKPAGWGSYLSATGYYAFSGNDTWRPLGTMTTRAAARIAGRSPIGHRVPWLVLHLLAGLLLAALGLSLGLPAQAAAWGAALFLLHPAHVETLLCASFNEDVLVGAGLAAMLLAHRRGQPLLAAAAYAAAALSKESGALGLPLVWLMDLLCPPERPNGSTCDPGRGAYVLYAAVLLSYAGLRFGPLSGPQAATGLADAIPWTERLVLAAMSSTTALRVLLAPIRLRLEYFALPPASWAAAGGWCAAAAASLAAWAALAWTCRRTPAAVFLLLWPLPLLAATSPLMPANVLNLRLMAERFLYAPSMGLALAGGWALRRRPALLAALLAAWTAAAAARAHDWAYEPRLWSSLTRIYPWSAKAHEGLGEAWLRQDDGARAAEAFRAALALRERRADPLLAHYAPLTRELTWDRASTHRNLALALMRLGKTREAEAELARAISLAPESEAFSYRALAYLLASEGRWDDATLIIAEGLLLHPGEPMLRRLARDAAARRLSFRANFF